LNELPLGSTAENYPPALLPSAVDFRRAVQNAKLMAKRKHLKLQCRSSLEKRQQCGKQRR